MCLVIFLVVPRLNPFARDEMQILTKLEHAVESR